MSAVLDELVSRFETERGDWTRVVSDARLSGPAPGAAPHAPARIGIARGRRPARLAGRRRRLVLIAAVVAAIAIPLVAVAAAQEWWFFRFPGAPTPVTGVTVVKTGSWDGKEWQLVAYRSSTDGICFGITPLETQTTGEGAGLACAQIEGVPRTPQSKPYDAPLGITFLAGSSWKLPTYIVGPVVENAAEVEIHLAGEAVVRTPTFDVPDELGAIRFYATQLPPIPTGEPPSARIRKLVGLDAHGQIVACLIDPMPEEGVPLSACR